MPPTSLKTHVRPAGPEVSEDGITVVELLEAHGVTDVEGDAAALVRVGVGDEVKGVCGGSGPRVNTCCDDKYP